MVYSLLAAADKTRAVSIGEAALYALLGFLIVFIGIAFLILVVWLVGKVVAFIENKQNQKETPAPVVAETLAVDESIDEELTEETVAVITAALMAYYQKNNPKCEFTVKRIKRI